MEYLSVQYINQLANTTSPSIDLIYLIKFVLYIVPKNDIRNINANINVVNHDEVGVV